MKIQACIKSLFIDFSLFFSGFHIKHGIHLMDIITLPIKIIFNPLHLLRLPLKLIFGVLGLILVPIRIIGFIIEVARIPLKIIHHIILAPIRAIFRVITAPIRLIHWIITLPFRIIKNIIWFPLTASNFIFDTIEKVVLLPLNIIRAIHRVVKILTFPLRLPFILIFRLPILRLIPFFLHLPGHVLHRLGLLISASLRFVFSIPARILLIPIYIIHFLITLPVRIITLPFRIIKHVGHLLIAPVKLVHHIAHGWVFP